MTDALPGRPSPLGATPRDGGTNFAVASGVAEGVEVCLFDDASGDEARAPAGWDQLYLGGPHWPRLGGIGIIVPDDAEVHVTGIGVMGAFEHGPTGTGQPGEPKIVINGLAFWGAVDVKRKPRKNKPKKTRKTLESGGEAAPDSPG